MSRVFSIAEGLENLGALRTGGQGSVYKAKRGETISAVKILPTPIHSESEDDKSYRDFQNEVSKLKKVNENPSPHVVKILSSGISESGSLPYIEMEFIEGPDLADLVEPPNDKTFRINESIKVAGQLSTALAHCHHVSVKHGDIKSNNVKLNTETGDYMLLDFGLSIMSDEQRRTSLRHAGAIEFMAPEQNDGEMLFESDVYSFGIILFELLAGTVPFPLNNKSETSRNAVMVSHIEKPVPDLTTLRRQNIPDTWNEEDVHREMEIPGWLIAVIGKCLEKRREDRFSDGMELNRVILDSISGKEEFSYTPKVIIAPFIPEPPTAAAPVAATVPTETQAEATPQATVEPKHHGTAALPWYQNASGRKPLVLAAIILAILLALFAGYSSLKEPSLASADSLEIGADQDRLLDSIAEAENQQRLDSIADAERQEAQQAENSQVTAPQNRGNGKGNSRGKGKGKKKK